MKKLVGIITVLALFTSVASAELLKNFKANGSIEALSITANNASDYDDAGVNDKYSETKARVIVGATFDLNDDVDAKVTAIKSDRHYGETTLAPQNANGILSAFTFEEAYINLKGVLGLDHRIGRQHYNTSDNLVIYYGPTGWFAEGLGAGAALDGWSSTYTKDKLTIGAISAKVFETAGSNTTMIDSDLYGLTANYDLYEYLNPGFYYYQRDDRTAGVTLQDKLTVMGVTAKGKVVGFNYGFEYAMNGGGDKANAGTSVDEEYAGTLMALSANYDLDVAKVGKFNFMGQYIVGSGDKTATDKKDKEFYDIRSNFRPGLIASGLAGGITSPGELTAMILGVNLTPNKWDGKLNLDAKMYNAKYTERTLDGIGTELDLIATWTHSDDVCLKLAYAMFTPDQDFAGVGAETDAASLINFYMNVKF